ncbi:MAG TPA: hypothetical protein PKA10_15895 [Selenomonadales bacterium]|nr:hypothetical protein [Selenomonadales bacterium]
MSQIVDKPRLADGLPGMAAETETTPIDRPSCALKSFGMARLR